MICDDCKHRDKCTKIISEGEKYCRDKKDCLETGYVRYDKCAEWSPKDFF